MFLSIVPFLYSKRTAAARSLVSLIEKRTFCRRYVLRSHHSWNYPALVRLRSGQCVNEVRYTFAERQTKTKDNHAVRPAIAVERTHPQTLHN